MQGKHQAGNVNAFLNLGIYRFFLKLPNRQDIELENWYKEKEKAVNMISAKKEKEIALLQTKLEQLEQQGGPVNQVLQSTLPVGTLSWIEGEGCVFDRSKI